MTLAIDPTTLPPAIKGWLGAHVAFRRDADALVRRGRRARSVRHRRRRPAGRRVRDHDRDAPRAPRDRGRAHLPRAHHPVARLRRRRHDDVARARRPRRCRRRHQPCPRHAHRASRHARTRCTRGLTRQAETFRILVNLHLEVEEDHALPMLLRCFTTDEIDAIGDEHFARNADALPVMIPWSATALPPEVVVEMLATCRWRCRRTTRAGASRSSRRSRRCSVQPAQAVAA